MTSRDLPIAMLLLTILGCLLLWTLTLLVTVVEEVVG